MMHFGGSQLFGVQAVPDGPAVQTGLDDKPRDQMARGCQQSVFVPGLFQIPVDMRLIDGPNGILMRGQSGEKNLSGIFKPGIAAQTDQKIDAVFSGHDMVADDERNRLFSNQLVKQFIGLSGRFGRHDVENAGQGFQILFHGSQNVSLIIDTENDGFDHERFLQDVSAALNASFSRMNGVLY